MSCAREGICVYIGAYSIRGMGEEFQKVHRWHHDSIESVEASGSLSAH